MVRVVFLHPDLGIGGAERAVVDAALALKSRGHSVQFVTAHHDTDHCFQETRDGTLQVTAVGDWLPRSAFGRFYAFFAYLRMVYAGLYLVFFSNIEFDLVFCDQISACIPVLRLSKAKVLFYCHFPDMLLTPRRTFLKKLYRTPLDWLEEKTTGMAHSILVNSKFTAGVFKETFTSLQHITPHVLYPIPDFSAFDLQIPDPTPDIMPEDAATVFLSINRYERKKNLGLAVEALGKLRDQLASLDGIHLIIAGGYDERVIENTEHHIELCYLTDSLGLHKHVTFLQNITHEQKCCLLYHSSCLLYTPDREHFGIVPIEAMYLKCPVIAVKSGGPLETIVDQHTGFLCEQDSESFAEAMMKFVQDKKIKETLGEQAKQHVMTKFSFEAFTTQLERIVQELCSSD